MGTHFIPDFAILISPVISMNKWAHKGSRDNLLGSNASTELKNMFSCDLRVTDKTPKTFIVHASNDRSVSSMNSILYYTALKEHNIKMSELHIFSEGGHGIALRNNPGTTNSWTYLCEQWLTDVGVIIGKK